MTNQQIIDKMSADHISDIQFFLDDGSSYEEALHRVKSRSCAGPAVWRVVAAHFGVPV